MSPLMNPNSTPRKSRKTKNPFSTRGLDKFSALLSELEEKKRKIYSEIDGDETPMVRFVFTTSNRCVPIVIKSKQKSRNTSNSGESKCSNLSRAESDKEIKNSDSDSDKKQCKLESEVRKMQRPVCYLPVTAILILVLLTFFGRSFAILLTCIGWYVAPTITNGKSAAKIVTNKKAYVRRLSHSHNNENKDSLKRRSRENDAVSDDKFPCPAAASRQSF